MAHQGGRPGRFSRRTLLSAAAAALVSADLAATARGGVLVDQRFDRMRDRNGWGRHWYARHFSLVFDVHRGRGRLHLPAGLKSTAPGQPIPVFLLDHECRDATHELHFQVTHAGLRPGIVLRRRDAFHYLAVTVEHRRLVLASYSRAERSVLAHARVVELDTGPHVLRVAVSGRTLRAGLWRAGHPPEHAARGAAAERRRRNAGCASGSADRRETRIVAGQPLRALGSAVSTHQPPGGAARHRHPAGERRPFTVGLRAACDVPASIQFEWSSDPSFTRAVERSPVHRPGPPFSARDQIVLTDARPVHWRARFVSTGSRHGGPLTHAAVHATARRRPARDGGSFVRSALAAAGLHGARPAARPLHRLQPAILVYQGDLGYAGNSRFSSYIEAPDFYFERFTRTLSDPHFETLRQPRSRSVSPAMTTTTASRTTRPRRGSRRGPCRCGTTSTPTRPCSATTTSASGTFTA